MDYFENLDSLLTAFWYIAIPSSIIFIIQTILTFIGGDFSHDVNGDFTSDFGDVEMPFHLFTFKNLINFLLGFSFTGISFFEIITNKPLLIGISFLVGLLFIFIFFVIIKQVQKLAENNSFKLEDTLNKSAEVYLNIPAQKTGIGKIIISTKGSYRELEAMTDSDRIPTGAMVKVVRIENKNILIVEKI